jgi:hypothetical protein
MNASTATVPQARRAEISRLRAFVLAAVVLAMRAPDSLTLAQSWAEDFFASQNGHALPQLFSRFVGSLDTLRRLVAWFGPAYSAAYVPAIYTCATIHWDGISCEPVESAACCLISIRTLMPRLSMKAAA